MFFPPQLAEPVRFIAWIPGNFQICCATLGGGFVGMIWEIQRGTYFARRVTVADEGWRMLIVITIFVSFLVFIGFHMMPSQSKKSTEYNIISVHEVTVNHEVYTCVCLAAVKTMLVLFECFFSFTKGMATNFYCYTYCIYVTCLQINTYFCRPET